MKLVFNSTLSPFIRSLAMHRAYSCIFHPCDLLLHFPLLHFPPLRSASVFSTPALSTPAILPVSHFPLLHFQSPQTELSCCGVYGTRVGLRRIRSWFDWSTFSRRRVGLCTNVGIHTKYSCTAHKMSASATDSTEWYIKTNGLGEMLISTHVGPHAPRRTRRAHRLLSAAQRTL